VTVKAKGAKHCSQCGKPFSARACGPTHALIAAERKAKGAKPVKAWVSRRWFSRVLSGCYYGHDWDDMETCCRCGCSRRWLRALAIGGRG